MAGMDAEEIYDPRAVAKRLRLSGAGLRRIARIYEDVYGPLRRDPPDAHKHGKRVWTSEAVARLERARDLVHAGRAGSIEAALRAGDATGDGVAEPRPTPRRTGESNIGAIEVLAEEVRRLREAVEQQTRLLEEQGSRVAALAVELEDPRELYLSATDPAGRGDDDVPEDQQTPEVATERPRWRRMFGS